MVQGASYLTASTATSSASTIATRGSQKGMCSIGASTAVQKAAAATMPPIQDHRGMAASSEL